MFFVHSLAIIKNHDVLPPPPLCPKRLKSHLSNETYCLGHSYQVAPANYEGRRKIGDTVYDVKPVTPDAPLEFVPGIFLGFPSRISITSFTRMESPTRGSRKGRRK